jgi:long-chain acyl-CoA synthetase
MIELPYRSVPDMLRRNAVAYAGQTAISYKKDGEWIALTYDHLYERVLMAGRGLRKVGVAAGDRVAIFSENRAGWVIADLGIQAVRAIPVPIYATNTPEQAAYVLNHAGCKVVFVSNRLQYNKLLKIREQIPGVETVIGFERFLGEKSLPVHTLYQLSEISHPISGEERAEIEGEIAAIQADDLLTLIYTSGTTGIPKGVMLTQRNVLFDAWYGLKHLGGLQPGEVFLSFLPLSHILERTAGYYAPLMSGCHVAFAESVEKVVENILEVRPTAMVSVPRLFEKIYSRIYENVHLASPLKKKLFHWAVEVGRAYVDQRYIRRQPVGLIGLQHRLAERLVFAKIRQRFGGRLRFFLSGGAPLDKTINEFLWIIGIPTFEGYGLTESSPAVTLNSPAAIRFGSVGKTLEFTEVRIEEDGELLVRGPQVMQGYYLDEEATAATVQDGWLRTGDIARIDEDGYVFIVDRKKELIVTAGGKNIAPQPLENALKLDKHISQAFVFGDRKPFLVALVTANVERLIAFAQQQKIDYIDLEDLASNEKVHKLFTERIGLLNEKLPPYETIKKFVVLARDFSIEGGELTPTLKLRRKVIYDKYKDRIEGLYLESSQTTSGLK